MEFIKPAGLHTEAQAFTQLPRSPCYRGLQWHLEQGSVTPNEGRASSHSDGPRGLGDLHH